MKANSLPTPQERQIFIEEMIMQYIEAAFGLVKKALELMEEIKQIDPRQ
jgi:hypothetical protein